MRINFIQNFIDKIRGKDKKKLFSNRVCMLELLHNSNAISEEQYTYFKDAYSKSKLLYLLKNDEYKKLLQNIDCTKLKAFGDLRTYQLRILDLAVKITSELKSANLHPMIIGGSLIGAKRHKGFIPWDDDMDFDLMRDEYEKLIKLAKEKYIWLDTSMCFNYNEFKVLVDYAMKIHPGMYVFAQKPSCISVYYGHSIIDCVSIDFFPREYTNMNQKDYNKFLKKCFCGFAKLKNFKKKFEYFDKQLSNKNVYTDDGMATVYSVANYGCRTTKNSCYMLKTDIFPLQDITFENYTFQTLKNIDKYMELMYSSDYMSLPLDPEFGVFINNMNKFLVKRGYKFNTKPEDFYG